MRLGLVWCGEAGKGLVWQVRHGKQTKGKELSMSNVIQEDEVRFQIMTITPDMAAKLLERNPMLWAGN